MFSSLFEKFRKTKLPKKQEDLDVEFETLKKQYCTLGNSELYQFFCEYFLTKMEINRDSLEKLNPYAESDKPKILFLQAQNKVMSEFMLDIEAMKQQQEMLIKPQE